LQSLHTLERLQAARAGQPVPPPAALDVTVSTGAGASAARRDLEAVWGWRRPEPIRHGSPLEPYPGILHDLVLEFPRPGRYDLVLLANGADVAHHGLQVRQG
jgi:hypothetical protein